MDKTVVLDTPAQINAFRLLTIRQGLKALICAGVSRTIVLSILSSLLG